MNILLSFKFPFFNFTNRGLTRDELAVNLTSKILQGPRLEFVRTMAIEIVGTGINSLDGYLEEWMTDDNYV